MIRRAIRWFYRRVLRALFETRDVSKAWLRADRLAQGKLVMAPPESLNRWTDRERAPWPDGPEYRQQRRLRRVR